MRSGFSPAKRFFGMYKGVESIAINAGSADCGALVGIVSSHARNCEESAAFRSHDDGLWSQELDFGNARNSLTN